MHRPCPAELQARSRDTAWEEIITPNKKATGFLQPAAYNFRLLTANKQIIRISIFYCSITGKHKRK